MFSSEQLKTPRFMTEGVDITYQQIPRSAGCRSHLTPLNYHGANNFHGVLQWREGGEKASHPFHQTGEAEPNIFGSCVVVINCLTRLSKRGIMTMLSASSRTVHQSTCRPCIRRKCSTCLLISPSAGKKRPLNIPKKLISMHNCKKFNVSFRWGLLKFAYFFKNVGWGRPYFYTWNH